MSEEYSPNEFYTHATDKKGHSSQVRTSLPPPMYNDIAAMIAGKRIPAYKTVQDFMRDAAFHRLQWLTDNIDGIDLQDELEVQRLRMETEAAVLHEEASMKMANDLIRLKHEAGLDEQARIKDMMYNALEASISSAAKDRIRSYL